MPTPPRDDQDSMRFRAPTLEDAIALAEQSLGARVRVVSANRIRRGGIGGFFASDLGVEVTVALDDETIEQALERLVAETAADERDQWISTQRAPAARLAEMGSVGTTVSTGTPAATATMGWMPLADDTTTVESFAPAPPRHEPTTMVRVEQIIEELQTLTAAPLFGGGTTRYGGRRAPEPMPAEPPAAPAVEAVVDALADATGVQRPAATPPATVVAEPADPSTTPALRFEPSPAAGPADHAVEAFVARATHRTQPMAVVAPMPTEVPAEMLAGVLAEVPVQPVADEPSAAPAPTPATAPDAPVSHAAAEIDLVPAGRPASSSPPSRRQVELAIAATDQLIESLRREDGVKRLSVRVILRTGDQREVEAAAEWEAS